MLKTNKKCKKKYANKAPMMSLDLKSQGILSFYFVKFLNIGASVTTHASTWASEYLIVKCNKPKIAKEQRIMRFLDDKKVHQIHWDVALKEFKAAN